MRPSRLLMLVGVLTVVGCAGPFIRSQSPEAESGESLPTTRLVGDLAVPFGMYPVKVEAVGLVTGLPGTGSDPEPSPQRDELLSEMKAHGVTYPNQVLASNTTALVLVRGFLRPGIQKGDHFDIEVRVPSRSGTTSLRGGWLMETRLTELAVLQGSVREGSLLALAEGPLLTDPTNDGKENQVAAGRGRILGGGVALKSRPLALVLKPDHRGVAASSQIGKAVNRRFHTFSAGVKQGAANPKDDQHVDLIVHPRYKDNIERYMQVVRSIALRESAAQQMSRLAVLQRQLLDPITSSTAALRLEAIGKDGIPALLEGLKSDDREVRFYSAEALAYLDRSEATAPLAAAARDVPAFRAYALAALSAMDDFTAYEALRGLLDVASTETRYGAFRALWAMNSRDALVRGENLRDQFSYHVLDSSGPTLVHVTRTYRPEVVLFGHEQRLTTPFVLEAGPNILLTGRDDAVTVSRFAANEADQKRVVSTKLDECIRAIVDLGGTYPDVVAALQQAKAKQALPARFAIDAVPDGGRRYERGSTKGGSEEGASEASTIPESPSAVAAEESGKADEEGAAPTVANPLPDLFASGKALEKQAQSEAKGEGTSEPGDAKKGRAGKSVLGKMR